MCNQLLDRLDIWSLNGLMFQPGGAQAIAAMAYGTESVPKVDKLCGPGNSFVTMAKMLVQNDSLASVSIDMPAGPSEVMVCSLFCKISFAQQQNNLDVLSDNEMFVIAESLSQNLESENEINFVAPFNVGLRY